MKKTEFSTLLGSKLRMLRKEYNNYTYDEFASLIGITKQQLNKYENGIDTISFLKIADLCSKLDVPISYFTGNSKDDDEIINGLSRMKKKEIELLKVIINFFKTKEGKNAKN